MKKYFLFDLDGTVTDTGLGIMQSAQLALNEWGFYNEPEENLRRFVGPPLDWSFREFYGLSMEDSYKAVEKYRESYRTEGVFVSPLYPGMKELLAELSQHGLVCLATSKPIFFADQIITLRGVKEYFSVAVGANLDGTMTDKAQVIAEVLKQLGDPPKEQVIMVGDRRHDIAGAKANGLETIGVEYGYAGPGELAEAVADHIVPTVEALLALCLKLCEE